MKTISSTNHHVDQRRHVDLAESSPSNTISAKRVDRSWSTVQRVVRRNNRMRNSE